MQLDLSTAMRGRRWTDGAVNVLVLVSLHAHLSDQVIRAVLDGVTEVIAPIHVIWNVLDEYGILNLLY
jgi:hypothetical protein